MIEAEYYRFNSLQLSAGQYYRWLGLSISLFGFLVQKLLRARVPNVYWPHPSLIEVIPAPSTEPAVRQLVERMVRESAAEGFDVVMYYRLPQISRTEGCTAALLSSDRQILALCAASTSRVGFSVVTNGHFGCTSRVGDDREIATTDAPPFLPTLPTMDVVRYRGASVREVIARHRARLAGCTPAAFAASPEALRDDYITDARRRIEFLVGLGFLSPMSPSEVAEAKK